VNVARAIIRELVGVHNTGAAEESQESLDSVAGAELALIRNEEVQYGTMLGQAIAYEIAALRERITTGTSSLATAQVGANQVSFCFFGVTTAVSF
jgi:hypothetical protein